MCDPRLGALGGLSVAAGSTCEQGSLGGLTEPCMALGDEVEEEGSGWKSLQTPGLELSEGERAIENSSVGGA